MLPICADDIFSLILLGSPYGIWANSPLKRHCEDQSKAVMQKLEAVALSRLVRGRDEKSEATMKKSEVVAL